jgi:hypothetical protein
MELWNYGARLLACDLLTLRLFLVVASRAVTVLTVQTDGLFLLATEVKAKVTSRIICRLATCGLQTQARHVVK